MYICTYVAYASLMLVAQPIAHMCQLLAWTSSSSSLPSLLLPHIQAHIPKALCIPRGKYCIIHYIVQPPIAYNVTALPRLHAMDSVILIISNRDYMNRSRKGIKGGLEANLFADRIQFSSHPRAPAGIQSPAGIGGSGYNDLQACRT